MSEFVVLGLFVLGVAVFLSGIILLALHHQDRGRHNKN